MNKLLEQALLDRGKSDGMSCDDMIVTNGNEQFVDLILLAGQHFHNLQFIMDPLSISTHKGDANGSFQCMTLLGKEKSSLSFLTTIAYDASIDDGPHTFTSGQ
jgi:hypothetical protein